MPFEVDGRYMTMAEKKKILRRNQERKVSGGDKDTQSQDQSERDEATD